MPEADGAGLEPGKRAGAARLAAQPDEPAGDATDQPAEPDPRAG